MGIQPSPSLPSLPPSLPISRCPCQNAAWTVGAMATRMPNKISPPPCQCSSLNTFVFFRPPLPVVKEGEKGEGKKEGGGQEERRMIKGIVACMKRTVRTGGVEAPATTMTTRDKVSRSAMRMMDQRGKRSIEGVISGGGRGVGKEVGVDVGAVRFVSVTPSRGRSGRQGRVLPEGCFIFL